MFVLRDFILFRLKPCWLQDLHVRSALGASISKKTTHPLPYLFCYYIFMVLPFGILFHLAVILASSAGFLIIYVILSQLFNAAICTDCSLDVLVTIFTSWCTHSRSRLDSLLQSGHLFDLIASIQHCDLY